jgi:hypothetical protein
MKLSPNVIEVGYYFDHGYNLAFVALIWTMGILFSTIAPLMPMIAFVFFLLKYQVDKYNFMYVYPAEFDSQQPFGLKVSYLCTASIFGFQMFMFMIFTVSFGRDFYVPAGTLLGIEFVGLFLKFTDFAWIYDKFKEPNLIDDVAIENDFIKTKELFQSRLEVIYEKGGVKKFQSSRELRATLSEELQSVLSIIDSLDNPN